VTWRSGLPGDGINSERDFDAYLRDARDASRTGVVWKATGDAAKGLAGAAKVLTQEYLSDLCYHAQMEPMNATADVRADGAEIWVGTQAPTRTQLDVATALGRTADKVKVHQHFLGGGFGRRATVESSVDAALVSKAVGKPVKLVLSREDDLWAGTFRAMTAQRISAGLDSSGRIVGWSHRVVGEPVGDFVYHPGYIKKAKDRDIIFMSGAELPYYNKVANWRSEHIMEAERTRVAAWRGIGSGYTKFAIESMIARGGCSTRWQRCPAGASSGPAGRRSASPLRSTASSRRRWDRSPPRWRRSRSTHAPAASASTTTGRRPTRGLRSTRTPSPRRWRARSSGA
jgi:isoquinoline 1-oxidoreductase beta subunit